MDLSKIRNKTRRLEFEYMDEVVTVDYTPAKMTRAYGEEFDKNIEATGQDEAAATLAAVVVAWSLTNGDEPFPPTYENAIQLPGALLNRITEGIIEDAGKLGTNKSKA